ncbi:hypothetical protein LOD99_7624 [Oopsacas minuta]|uniref:Uncharacterized protein n=1 Tax=Oopsacas minuta TaxID=111878 RepID=A0AAV7JQ24_9METZ|nr:hypothetical protein LOD99_7624 [Oopsacas minuta]
MTTGQYTPIQELPTNHDEIPLHPLNTESSSSHKIATVHDVTDEQVTALCLLCSILNYLCCPFLGIPALIFAIMGIEAEKRGEFEAAKSHAFHLKIFNIIYAVKLIIFLIFSSLCCLLFFIVFIVALIKGTATSDHY